MIRNLKSCLAAAVAVGAVAAPVASAMDVRSSHAGDAARSGQPNSSPIDHGSASADASRAEQSRPSTDVRSADARDAAASRAERSRPSTDVRSADARDAALPRQFVSLPPVEIVRTVKAGGFHWGDAAIGAGVLLVVMLMGGAGLLLLRRGPRVSPAR